MGRSRSRDRDRKSKKDSRHRDRSSKRDKKDKDKKKRRHRDSEDDLGGLDFKLPVGGSKWSEAQDPSIMRDEDGKIIEQIMNINEKKDGGTEKLQEEMSGIFSKIISNSSINENMKTGGAQDFKSYAPRGRAHPTSTQHSALNMLNDQNKIMRKILIPTGTNFNYTGLIIGPKGAN